VYRQRIASTTRIHQNSPNESVTLLPAGRSDKHHQHVRPNEVKHQGRGQPVAKNCRDNTTIPNGLLGEGPGHTSCGGTALASQFLIHGQYWVQ
jgi:hypothetical protein